MAPQTCFLFVQLPEGCVYSAQSSKPNSYRVEHVDGCGCRGTLRILWEDAEVYGLPAGVPVASWGNVGVDPLIVLGVSHASMIVTLYDGSKVHLERECGAAFSAGSVSTVECELHSTV